MGTRMCLYRSCSGSWTVGLAATVVGGTVLVAMMVGAGDGKPRQNAAGSSAQANQATKRQLVDRTNLALGLAASQVISLQIDPTPGVPLRTRVQIDGRAYTLDLSPHSVQSRDYQVLVGVNGQLEPVAPGPIRTLRGRVLEQPGSIVAGSLLPDGLHAMIRLPDGERMWIEPIGLRVDGARPGHHVVYNSHDVLETGGTCGVNDAFLGKQAGEFGGAGAEADGGVAGTGALICAELAIDADFPYFQAHGSSVANVESAVNSIINTMNVQYETEVNLRHQITTIVVRTLPFNGTSTDPARDPYNTTSAASLLSAFKSHWIVNHSSIVRDVAELFTGRNLDGSVIGIAYFAGICNNDGYNVVQSDFSGNFSCKTDLSAHELGHNWNARHCGDFGGGCGCGTTCTSCTSTMSCSITCTNTFSNSNPSSSSAISTYRDTRNCLSVCENTPTPLPFFDDFPTTVIDDGKWTGVEGAEVNMLGQNEPSSPYSLNLDGSADGGDQIRSGVIDAGNLVEVTLSFWYQRGGGGTPPIAGEDLIVEFRDATDAWVEVDRQLGSGVPMTAFEQVTLNFPPESFHSDLRVRFRVSSLSSGFADWFIDDVGITGVIPPPNNNCSNTNPLVFVGSTPFTTVGATTDGPAEAECEFNGYDHIERDVWYRFITGCEGTATVSLCGADYDSKIVVYNSACPGGGFEQVLACSDNDCDDDPEVSFSVVSNTIYRIRIGGIQGAVGTGTMVIDCVEPPCPGDIDASGAVDVTDLLAVIGAWGPCPGCPEDVSPAPNGDGTVDVSDLLLIIGQWGACP